VLRGEALLEAGDAEGAAAYFQEGLRLAQAQIGAADWGYVNGALIAAAEAGLRRCGLAR
jgi:hypothetical protein